MLGGIGLLAVGMFFGTLIAGNISLLGMACITLVRM